MSLFQKILFSICILRIFLPLANSAPLLVDNVTKEPIRWHNLPEYKEYLKQQQQAKSSSGAATSTTVILPPSTAATAAVLLANEDEGKYEHMHSDNPLGPIGQFPAIQLCRESPKGNNVYGHIYCMAMVIMYALLVLSLIIYVLRSIGRLSKKTPYEFGSHFELKCGLDGTKNEDEQKIQKGKDEDQLDHIHGPTIMEAYKKGLKGKEVTEYIAIVENEKNKKKKNGN